MFERSVRSDALFAARPTRRRGQQPGHFALCCLSASAIMFAIASASHADGFDWNWGSGKVSADAYLRVSPLDAAQWPADTKNLQAEFDIFKNTQMQLLSSPMVLRAALKRPGVADLEIVKKQQNPLEWLGRNVQVKSPANTEIIEVSVSGAGATPKELATLVNAVVDAYMMKTDESESVKREQRMANLRRRQEEKTREVKEAMTDLRRIADSLGGCQDSLTVQQKTALDELATCRTELLRSQSELKRMRAELAARKAERDSVEQQPITDVEVQAICPNDPILQELGARLAEMDRVADEARNVLERSKQSLVPQTAKQKERIEEKYNARLDQLKQQLAEKKKADIEREIKKLEASIDILTKQHEVALEELKILRKEADRFGFSSIDMEMRRAAIVNAQKALDAITAEIDRLQMDSLAPSRITVLEKAEVPE
jgi:polysaccharide biosynthesis transport protein